MWVVLASLSVVGAGLAGKPLLGLCLAVVVLTGGWLAAAARRDRLQRRGQQALGRALRLLCAELAAGSRPGAALAAAGPVAGEFRPAFASAAQVADEGGEVADELEAVDELQPLAAAWRIAHRTGAGLTDVLSQVEADLAGRQQQMVEVATALAGARSSAVLLALLPAFGLALGTAMGARPLALLFGPSAGQALLGAGVLLDAMGLVWTARLVARAAR
jgi:tight adherence protein B